MNFFDQVPEGLFTLLTSKNKRIYIDALFVVWECFKYELTVTRSDLQSALISRMEDEIYALEAEAEAPQSGAQPSDALPQDLSARASFIIRRLLDTQWLRSEMRGEDFENMVSLPDYAQKLLDVFVSLKSQREAEYNGLVVSCYNNLKAADIERGDYAFNALNRAYSDTQSLIDLLKGLYHNIGRYHQMTLQTSDVNQLLATHFDDFQEVIVAQFLHPFKTFDSVPRFKGPILELLNRWYQDEDLTDLMAKQAGRYLNIKDSLDAHEQVMRQISGLLEMYEGLQGLIDQIDHRHNAFTRVSVEKIQYLINRDQSAKGKLVQAIQLLREDGLTPEDLGDAVQVFRQQYVEPGSLYNRTRSEKSRVTTSEAIRVLDAEEKASATTSFMDKVRATYGREAVIKEVMALFEEAGTSRLSLETLPLETDKDFARAILASIIGAGGQRRVPFSTAFGEAYHESGLYRVPNNTLIAQGATKADSVQKEK